MGGWLPPGCTDLDVDMACPGYWDEPQEEEMDFGKRMTSQELNDAMIALGLTEQSLAAKLGKTRRTVQRYLYNETEIPRQTALIIRMWLEGSDGR